MIPKKLILVAFGVTLLLGKNITLDAVKKNQEKKLTINFSKEEGSAYVFILYRQDKKIFMRVADDKNKYRVLNTSQDKTLLEDANSLEKKTYVKKVDLQGEAPWLEIGTVLANEKLHINDTGTCDGKKSTIDKNFKEALKEAKIWEIFELKEQTSEDASFLETYAPIAVYGLIGMGLLSGTYWWLYKKYFRHRPQ